MFYVFLVCLPGITRPGWSKRGLRRSNDVAGGGGPQLAVPPGPRLAITKFWHCIQPTTVYSVLQSLTLLSPPRISHPFIETVSKQFFHLWKWL